MLLFFFARLHHAIRKAAKLEAEAALTWWSTGNHLQRTRLHLEAPAPA